MEYSSKRIQLVHIFILALIVIAVILGLYITQNPQPIQTRPKAEELQETPKLSFKIDKDLAPGQVFNLSVMVDPGNTPFHGFELLFSYNPLLVEPEDPQNPLSFSSAYQIVTGGVSYIDQLGGFIKMVGTKLGEDSISGTEMVPLVSVRLRVKNTAQIGETVAFGWDSAGTRLADPKNEIRPNVDIGVYSVLGEPAEPTQEPQPTLPIEPTSPPEIITVPPTSPIPTLGDITVTPIPPFTDITPPLVPTGSGQLSSVTLDLKVKFQGILKKPTVSDPATIKVTLAGGALVTPVSRSSDFNVDDQGIWSGRVTFDAISVGGGYRILMKGPQHLQKRFCDGNPSETYPGSYSCYDGRITLVAGVNNFDFSNVFQLVGDLPEQNGAQNGFVNSYDISLVRNNIINPDPASLKWADLNRDRVINSQDYSLIIAALEFRSDESIL